MITIDVSLDYETGIPIVPNEIKERVRRGEEITIRIINTGSGYVKNALQHGVAGLNIDGGRINLQDGETTRGSGRSQSNDPSVIFGDYGEKRVGISNIHSTEGRWPANVILSHHPDCEETDETITVEGRTLNRWKDNAHPFGGGAGNEYEREQMEDDVIVIWKCVEDCPLRMLDEQTGTLTSGDSKGFKGKHTADVYGKYANNLIRPEVVYADSGGASRFFYCAKASKRERNMGLDGGEKQKRDESRHSGQISMNDGEGNPYNRGAKPVVNYHPTVKPLALMQYLVRLTKTPTGGIVIDPFMGTCTTGMACVLEGRDFIGIDSDEGYYEISKKRVAAVRKIQPQIKMDI